MKATIDKDGMLMVIAETDLESFALSRWYEELNGMNFADHSKPCGFGVRMHDEKQDDSDV